MGAAFWPTARAVSSSWMPHSFIMPCSRLRIETSSDFESAFLNSAATSDPALLATPSSAFAATSTSSSPWLPARAARMAAVSPSKSVALTSAPFSSRRCATSAASALAESAGAPNSDTRRSGVCPSSSAVVTSAPASISRFTACRFPASAAKASAVAPWESALFTSAPALIKVWIILRSAVGFERSEAMMRAVAPVPVIALTSAPASMRRPTISGSLDSTAHRRAVNSVSSMYSRSAPASTSSFATASFPLHAAAHNATARCSSDGGGSSFIPLPTASTSPSRAAKMKSDTSATPASVSAATTPSLSPVTFSFPFLSEPIANKASERAV
mmetsp:Transcript_21513/g.47193  ORF Transcript_21513/g.47193 Transcript_21513/m.47193 type:complete len:329 (-) Transcript_21513:56-1042(-)